MGLWSAYVNASRVKFIGSAVYEHLVGPFVASYIDGIDVESKMQKDHDVSEYTEEELAKYESAGNDMATLAENITKYNVDMSDQNSIKGALFRMAGRIGECAADDPVVAGSYVIDLKFGSNQLLGAAQYVNNKVEQSEANGEEITSDKILSWGKEGLGMAALGTVSEMGSKAVESDESDIVDEAKAQSIDRDALADDLVSSIASADGASETVDLDSISYS